MIIKNIQLNNFGVFRGNHLIDLAPTKVRNKNRPIILFGGKNGCGKTTILEAIQLCLYGSGIVKLIERKCAYDAYLDSRIHRPTDPLFAPSTASVKLDFDYGHAGRVDTYTVHREWDITHGKTKEKLFVYKNQELLEDLDAENWQEFLWDLLPPRLSGLFFFDGEKIQRLVQDATSHEESRLAIETILSLDLVDRLQADVNIYHTRLLKNTPHDGLNDKYLAL
nr:AAA family ATPase [Synergistaceae bacterium]